MTPAEVASAIGSPPTGIFPGPSYYDGVASEGPPPPNLPDGQLSRLSLDTWFDEPVAIEVFYLDGKAISKDISIRVPPWKMKTRSWLYSWFYWLRGLVGR
jgi:hypothetical protein